MRFLPKAWSRKPIDHDGEGGNYIETELGPDNGPILDTVIFADDDGEVELTTVDVFENILDGMQPGEILQLRADEMSIGLRDRADPSGVVPNDAVADIRLNPDGSKGAQIAWRRADDPIGFEAIDAAESAGKLPIGRTPFLTSRELFEAFGNVAPDPQQGNPKDRLGDLKPDLSLNPPVALLYMSLGFKDGAVKYGPFNWRENKVRNRVYIAAAMRHIEQYRDGEDIDPLSGKPHIGHALASLAIIADATEGGMLIDDRPLPGKAGNMIRHITETGNK